MSLRTSERPSSTLLVLGVEHRQQDSRGVVRVVIDDLVGNAELRSGRQWLAAAAVAHKMGVRAAGDLQANALPLAEVVGGGPDLDRNVQAAIPAS